MLCILCVTPPVQIIEIFSEDGIRLNAFDVISKHFWLKPNVDDPNAKVICRSCWNAVDSFHTFFQMIEEAHAKLSTTNIFNRDGASDDGNSFAFDDLLTAEYDIKPETLGIDEHEPVAFSDDKEDAVFGQETCPKRNISCSPPPLAKVKIKSEECKVDNILEKDADSELIIPSVVPNTKHSRTRFKRIKNNGSNDKKYEKKKVPCQKFDEVIRDNMELSCTICKKSLSSFFTLKKHYKSEHKENGYVICCGKKFESRHDLVHHILLHTDPEFFKCDICGRVFNYKKGLMVHLKRHIEKDKSYECEKCKKIFFRKDRLESHMKTHLKREQICEQCGKVTQSLKQHQLHAHSDTPREREQCPKCLKYLADKFTLKRHMINVHPEQKVLNVCNICGKVSSSANGLKRHILYMHKAERRYKCLMCEKAFKAPQVLRVS